MAANERRIAQRIKWRQLARAEFNTEAYDPLVDNPFLAAADNPLSTFSIDVDTASYSNIRRFLLQQNQLPPPGAVRIEELINYFRYDYPQPEGERAVFGHDRSGQLPVGGGASVGAHRAERARDCGRQAAADEPGVSDRCFRLDGTAQQTAAGARIAEAADQAVGENDHVAIVVYAGNSGLVLPSTRGDKHEEIIAAIDRLRAGGSTNGGQGIELAYEIASQNFHQGRRESRDSGHRRRFQRRHHQPGRTRAADSRESQNRRVS